MDLNDFTPRQAQAWIAQEFAKVTANNADARLRSEQRMIEFGEANGFAETMPNSLNAHRGLAAKIQESFL